LTNILDRRNCKMGIARSGEKTIAMSHKNGDDIIFIDMKLPATSGLEAPLAMEKDQSGNGGHHDDCNRHEMNALVEEALDNWAYACLYRSLDIESLPNLVDEICERRQKAGWV
jgi:DNA-binding NtrC family response regulator